MVSMERDAARQVARKISKQNREDEFADSVAKIVKEKHRMGKEGGGLSLRNTNQSNTSCSAEMTKAISEDM